MSELTCEYQPACPGCPRLGQEDLDRSQMRRLEELLASFSSRRTERLEVYPFDGVGARHRVRLSVRGKVGALGIGIFEQGSHRLVSIPNCQVHHPGIRRFLPRLIEVLNQAQVFPYDESRHAGELKAVQLAANTISGDLQVVLLVRHDEPIPSGRLSAAIEHIKALPGVHSVFIGNLPRPTNSLFPEGYRLVYGGPMLEEQCGGATNFYPPGAFGQANPVQHERVVNKIASHVPGGGGVYEYYSGVGSIGLALAARGDRLRFNELGAGSIEGLRAGWQKLRGEERLRIDEGRAGEHANSYSVDETVVADPPRKGLDAAVFDRLLDQPPARLVYLSCGLDALIREAQGLGASGQYELTHLSAWAYFPFTSHVETLMILERRAD